MARASEKDLVERYRALFAEREAYLRSFEERKAAFDQQLADQEMRRQAFNEGLRGEIGVAQARLAELAPLSADELESVPMRRAAYSDRMASVMAKLALFAYVQFEDDDRLPVLRTALEHGGLTLCGYWAVGDTECYMAEAEQFIAVSFRGTTTRKDRKTDLAFGVSRVQVPGHAAEVRVHEGFYEAYRLIEQGLRAALQASAQTKPIFLTGHSLGGALALVASAALSGSDALGNRIAAVYTFGAPRVGGDGFERVVKAPHYRIVNEGDVVPLVPPNWLFGYRHTGELQLLRRGTVHPVRTRPWLATILLALRGILAWPFSRQLLFARRHAVSLYASRLEVIAAERGWWS